MNTDKWTVEHHKTHQVILDTQKEIDLLEIEYNEIKEKYDRKIGKLYQKIQKEINNCIHIDNGGFFVAGCDICGWKDSYDGG